MSLPGVRTVAADVAQAYFNYKGITYVKIHGVADAIDAINNYYLSHGLQPFTVAIFDHGAIAGGDLGFGAGVGDDDSKVLRYNDSNTASQLTMFTQTLSTCHVSKVDFLECYAAIPGSGAALLQKIAHDGNTIVTGYKNEIYVNYIPGFLGIGEGGSFWHLFSDPTQFFYP